MTRRGFIKGLLGVILTGLFAGLYGFFVEPALRLRVKRWQITRKDWTAPPLRIVAISDIHLGAPFVSLRRLRQVVARANALGGDVIVLLGDYAAGHRFITQDIPIADAAPVLAGLTAPQGVFGILGNHDWWSDKTAQKQRGLPNLYADALRAEGITMLSNDAIKLPSGAWIAGLEDQLALLRTPESPKIKGLHDVPATLSKVTDDSPVVLLAHEPDIFANLPERFAVTLSGHTHGGQVRLFGWSPVVPSRYGNRYAYGHVREEGRDLVVSGGIGCSIAPLRFGVVPEITVIEIGQG